MKDPLAPYRDHPHLVAKGPRRNWRRPLVLSNEPVAAGFALDDDVLVAPGVVDADGGITERGRQLLRRRTAVRARKERGRLCIVWSPTSCTWFDADGRMVEGTNPPEGELFNPWICRRQPIELENCHTIRLPEGCDASHLCIRRIGRPLVEISPGAPIVLVDFDVPHVPGMADPAADLLTGPTRLRTPTSYRGVRVERREGWRLLGPVQPQDGGRILRNPWPEDVRAACVEIAGAELPARLTDAAWRAIDPRAPDLNLVGVLRAA